MWNFKEKKQKNKVKKKKSKLNYKKRITKKEAILRMILSH